MNESDPPSERNESPRTPMAPSEPPPGDIPAEAPAGSSADPSATATNSSSLEHTEDDNTPPTAEEAVAPRPVQTSIPVPLTVLISLVAVAVIVIEVWPFWSRPAVEGLYYPMEMALRVVERGMEFREAAHRAGPFARALLWLRGDRPERDAKEYPRIWQEVLRAPAGGAVEEESKPWLQAHLVVLLG